MSDLHYRCCEHCSAAQKTMHGTSCPDRHRVPCSVQACRHKTASQQVSRTAAKEALNE